MAPSADKSHEVLREITWFSAGGGARLAEGMQAPLSTSKVKSSITRAAKFAAISVLTQLRLAEKCVENFKEEYNHFVRDVTSVPAPGIRVGEESTTQVRYVVPSLSGMVEAFRGHCRNTLNCLVELVRAVARRSDLQFQSEDCGGSVISAIVALNLGIAPSLAAALSEALEKDRQWIDQLAGTKASGSRYSSGSLQWVLTTYYWSSSGSCEIRIDRVPSLEDGRPVLDHLESDLLQIKRFCESWANLALAKLVS
jgi:hypothetical protein